MVEILDLKERLRREISKLLTGEERVKARKDHHARRKPRPCGITIHTGIGCSLRCLYCYIEDMGFKWNIEPYPLNGLQLVYALLENPYFLPGEQGTLVAIGSVTEPFHPITREKTFEYIEAITKHLGNPIQFSTKMSLSQEDAYRLREIDHRISPLVTILTLEYSHKLEPYAPSPEERFETIKVLSKAGLKPILFYRPLIPGIADQEYREILRKARRAGAVGVVVGSLRVSRLILSRLRSVGLPVEEIIGRLPRIPRGDEQITVRASDLKNMVLEYARRIGLTPFPEACMANIYTHGYVCWKMVTRGILVDREPPAIEKGYIYSVARDLGLRITGIGIRKGLMEIKVQGGNRYKRYLLGEIIKYRFRICTRVY